MPPFFTQKSVEDRGSSDSPETGSLSAITGAPGRLITVLAQEWISAGWGTLRSNQCLSEPQSGAYSVPSSQLIHFKVGNYSKGVKACQSRSNGPSEAPLNLAQNPLIHLRQKHTHQRTPRHLNSRQPDKYKLFLA